jgi:transposase
VNTTQANHLDGRVRRRNHEPEFKAAVVAECSRPGVSIAGVALHHRLNANLLRRWVVQAGGSQNDDSPENASGSQGETTAPNTGFLPVTIESSAAASKTMIDVEVRRGATVVKVSWPMAAASDLGAWMRELLR